MEDYDHVRALYFTEGLSLRAIARRTKFHRSTVKKIIEESEPPGYQRREPAKEPVLGPFKGIIDRILRMDREAPKKQRHKALRIWERLKEEYGYPGGYTQVREYVAKECNKKKEAFVPLEFGPGEAQVDCKHSMNPCHLLVGRRLAMYFCWTQGHRMCKVAAWKCLPTSSLICVSKLAIGVRNTPWPRKERLFGKVKRKRLRDWSKP